MQKEGARLKHLSQQIEIAPLDTSLLHQRSLVLAAEGDYDQAIVDLSKMIVVQPSRDTYLRRSQLYQQQDRFTDSIRDLQMAREYSQEGEESAGDVYLKESVCMRHLEEVEQLAELSQEVQVKEPERYVETLRALLRIKEFELEKQKKERAIEIKALKTFYEQQEQAMRDLLRQELSSVKQQLGLLLTNYTAKYEKQLQMAKISQGAKCTMMAYFQGLVSEMEKYYVAAKNLHKIQDSSIKFEDIEIILEKKSETQSYALKIFKMFDRYSGYVDKLEGLVKHVPYIGAAFQVIKLTMKAKGRQENINMSQQCHNITRMAPTITLFNEYAGNLAYFMARHYQDEILEHEEGTVSPKSAWSHLANKIAEYKASMVGDPHYQTNLSPSEERAHHLATIHASILMVATACNQLPVSRQDIKTANKLAQTDSKAAESQIWEVFDTLDEVCAVLRTPGSGNGGVGEGSSCDIY